MIFKDRCAAGKKLGEIVAKKLQGIHSNDIVVISLLRGGIIVGCEVAKTLHATHLPLAVTKITAPHSEELAIGAVCYDITYLDRNIIHYIGNIPRPLIRAQVEDAQLIFDDSLDRYYLHELEYERLLKDKTVVIVDDGVATGASTKAAYLFIRAFHPTNVIVATPVMLGPLNIPKVEVVTFIPEGESGSVSQFYESFPQIEDEEILRMLKTS